MKVKEKERLISQLIQRGKCDDKSFLFDLSLQGKFIENLDDNFRLKLTDYTSTKYRIGYSEVVGEIQDNDNFIVYGVRTGENSFSVDLIDIKRDIAYSIFVVDDFVVMHQKFRVVEIDEEYVLTKTRLNYVLKKIAKKENKLIDEKLVENFENKLNGNFYYTSFLKGYLKETFYLVGQTNSIASNMINELNKFEIKVYVNIIHNYFEKNPDLNIFDYCEDKKIAQELTRIRNKPISKTYHLFTKYPSYVYSIFDKIKEKHKDNAVFGEYEDMTSCLL